MTSAQVVETSVTNNSLSKDYPHQDDHAKQILLLLSNQVETDLHVKTNQYVRYVAIFVGIIHSVQLSLSWVLIDSFVKFKKWQGILDKTVFFFFAFPTLLCESQNERSV